MYSLGHSVQKSEIRGEQGDLSWLKRRSSGGSCAGSPASVVCFPFLTFPLVQCPECCSQDLCFLQLSPHFLCVHLPDWLVCPCFLPAFQSLTLSVKYNPSEHSLYPAWDMYLNHTRALPHLGTLSYLTLLLG